MGMEVGGGIQIGGSITFQSEVPPVFYFIGTENGLILTTESGQELVTAQ
jgi:hypothetical protein